MRRRGLVTAMSCACAALLCFFRVVTSLALLLVKATQSHSRQQHFELRLTAPRQMNLHGRILKAELVHFLLHVSGTVPPCTRAPGAGPSHWPKKLR